MRSLRALLLGIGAVATVSIVLLLDRGSHSVSDTLYGSALWVLITWALVALTLALVSRRGQAR